LSYRPTWNKVCKPDQTLLQEFAGGYRRARRNR